MSTTTLLILVLIALLILGIAIFLYLVLRRARRISFAAEPKANGEPDKKRQAPEEFLQYASNATLRFSFRRALKLLRSYVTGRDYRYRVPWFLMTGESDSGKTSILDGNGVNLSANGTRPADRQLNWYFFNEGIVIDVAGNFVLRSDGTANHRGWNTISRLLLKHRPRRPLDGIVLTIPCAELVGQPEASSELRFKLEEKAGCLYQKLWQSQRILGMRLPVYVLVTKCDQVTGFSSFCRQLPERLHTQMFGWSNPTTLETAYQPELVAEAFGSLHEHVSRLQYEIYAERDEIQDVDDLFLFPAALQSMRGSLQIYLDGLFKQSAYHESFLFRGLYFCGETPGDSQAGSPFSKGSEENWVRDLETLDSAPSQEPTETSERKPIFVTDLFREKIFAEDFLAQPVRKIALSRNRAVIGAQILSLFILLVGGVGLTASYQRLSTREANLYEFLMEELADLKRVEEFYGRHHPDEAYEQHNSSWAGWTYQLASFSDDQIAVDGPPNKQNVDLNEQMLHDGEAQLLDGMAKVGGKSFRSIFIPSSWFSSINEDVESAIEASFKYVIFESLRTDLERHASDLLSLTATSWPSASSRSETVDEEQPLQTDPSSSRQPVNHSFQLPLYIEQLGELRLNLERYARLIRDDAGSFDDLNSLVEYLGHSPVPADFDKQNYLFKRALKNSTGRSIETRQFYKESAGRVAERIEDLYEGSFTRHGVKYDHLEEIVEAEAVLRRPDFTWLSTFVFDPRSPFQGMTISSALIDLKQALQDLKRQQFMSRDALEGTTHHQHRVRSVLVWDQETLRQAISLNDQYEQFVGTKSYEPSLQLDNSVKDAARSRVKTRIEKLILRARKYQPLAPATEGSALKVSLIAEVQHLQNAQPVLTRTLEVTSRLGIDRVLRAALAEQGTYLLRGIQREFVAGRFYVAKQRDFAWWDGRQPVSYLVYDLQNPEELATYLNIQRKNIAFLGRDLVVPVMTFFASQNIYLPSGESQVDWDQILSDLAAFDNKTPGNPIAALEAFVSTEMDRVSIDSCAGVSRISTDGSADYFLRIRNALRVEFYARCKQLARIKLVNDTLAELENYEEIEKSFRENLAGGFPFAGVNGPPLEPSAMLKFFKVLDLREKAARDALNRSAQFGANPHQATEFLDQISRVREFFAPFLEKKQGPAFDFQVQFRVNRDQETAANQVIDWKLEVGKKKFSYLSDDLTGRWILGDPIRLTLRWANDAPSRPVPSTTPLPFAVKERNAIFEYNDRWSLFTLLLKHGYQLKRAGAPADCDQGFDANPYTLKFTIKTEPDPAAQSHNVNASPAEVFLRVSMLTANKPEPLMLPCFPVKAPPAPILFVQGTNNAANEDE